MSNIVLNQYSFIEKSDAICNNHNRVYINVKNYRDLIRKLKIINYDHAGTLNGYVNKCKDILEEVIINKNEIELSSDSTKIKYKDFTFVIDIHCNNIAKITIKDECDYCEDCYKKTNHPDINNLKNILENPIKYLSVSKKILYILNETKQKMESKDIYDYGKPWNITGSTQINTIQARCSTLFKNGVIKKELNKYFI